MRNLRQHMPGQRPEEFVGAKRREISPRIRGLGRADAELNIERR